MGASGSKVAQNGARKFPTRAPGSAPPSSAAAARPPRPPPESRPRRPQASLTKDDAIRADSIDPSRPESISSGFADRLRQMGVAEPNPTFSPSSTVTQFPDALSAHSAVSAPRFAPSSSNTTLGVLEARRRLQAQADEELGNMGRPGSQGREFLDIATIRKILVLRQSGEPAAEIESRLNLKPGMVARLASLDVVAPT